MNRVFLLALASIVFVVPAFRAAESTDWRWVDVRPHDAGNPVSWDVGQGAARNVEFDGKKFRADLYTLDLTVYPKADPDILLRGTITNGKIVATATYLGTEADPETFRGTVQVIPLGNGWVTERIVLNETGFSFIGITRLVPAEVVKEK